MYCNDAYPCHMSYIIFYIFIFHIFHSPDKCWCVRNYIVMKNIHQASYYVYIYIYIFICRHKCFAIFWLVSAKQNVETKPTKVHIPRQSAQATVCIVLSIILVPLYSVLMCLLMRSIVVSDYTFIESSSSSSSSSSDPLRNCITQTYVRYIYSSADTSVAPCFGSSVQNRMLRPNLKRFI